jgi:hypothetical protein
MRPTDSDDVWLAVVTINELCHREDVAEVEWQDAAVMCEAFGRPGFARRLRSHASRDIDMLRTVSNELLAIAKRDGVRSPGGKIRIPPYINEKMIENGLGTLLGWVMDEIKVEYATPPVEVIDRHPDRDPSKSYICIHSRGKHLWAVDVLACGPKQARVRLLLRTNLPRGFTEAGSVVNVPAWCVVRATKGLEG